MYSFKAKIEIIGVNPFVFLPERVLNSIFQQAGRERGPIPVCGTIEGYPFIQTLVKYSGHWRLYINIPMLKGSRRKLGDAVRLEIEFDPKARTIPIHPKLQAALKKNKQAMKVFENLSPSRQKEIIRYIGHLKTEVSVERNVKRAIGFLTGKTRFVGRDKA